MKAVYRNNRKNKKYAPLNLMSTESPFDVHDILIHMKTVTGDRFAPWTSNRDVQMNTCKCVDVRVLGVSPNE